MNGCMVLVTPSAARSAVSLGLLRNNIWISGPGYQEQTLVLHAANGGFSNWVFGSSSFSFFLLGHCHSSGSRFSSQSGWCQDGTAARICRIGRGEPC